MDAAGAGQEVAGRTDRGLMHLNRRSGHAGLSERGVPRILQAARDAGATWAGHSLLRLPGPVAGVFEQAPRERPQGRAVAVLAWLVRMRQGQLAQAFGQRLAGRGPEGRLARDPVTAWRRRPGLTDAPSEPAPSPCRRPRRGPQQELFPAPA